MDLEGGLKTICLGKEKNPLAIWLLNMRLFYSEAGIEWKFNKYIDIVFRGYLVAVAPMNSSSGRRKAELSGSLVMACHWKPLWWMAMLDWKRHVIYIRLTFYLAPSCSLLVTLTLFLLLCTMLGDSWGIWEQPRADRGHKQWWEIIFS